MLTLCYFTATWVQSWRLNTLAHKLRNVSEKHGSLIVFQEIPPLLYSVGSAYGKKLESSGIVSDHCLNYKSAHIGDLFWYHDTKRAVTVYPKQILDVSGWITVLRRKTHLPIQFNNFKRKAVRKDDLVFLLVEANYLTCSFDFQGLTIELDHFGTPLAWHASDRISILLETNEHDLSQLLLSFIQNSVCLENGIQIIRMETVEPLGSPYKIGNDQSVPETYAHLSGCLNGPELKAFFLDRWRAHVSMLCSFSEAVSQVKEAQQDISVRHPGSGVGAVKLIPGNQPIGVNPELLGETKDIQIDQNTSTTVYGSGGHTAQSNDRILTRCSSVQSSQISTEVSSAEGSTRQVVESVTTSMSSIRSLPSTPRRTVCSTPVNCATKPPNIIIFSDSPSALESVKSALESTLLTNRYVIHKFTFAEMQSPMWLDDSVLVVIHGNVPSTFIPVLMNYLAKGSVSLFCLCSDFLGNILPLFQTAEVRPNELVHCSYKSWKHALLMHHVFCYQPTPSDPKFSYNENASLKAIPETIEVTDSSGKKSSLKIDVLGVEDTWRTPSFLLVTYKDIASKIVFSQVHLEVPPDQYADSENKKEVLQNSDKARLGILSDILANHLDLKCGQISARKISSSNYSVGYFLGNHEAKQKLMNKLMEDKKLENNTLTCGTTKLKFCGKGVTPPGANESLFPILLHSCPETFSTVEYFENLKTQHFGRLVVFSEVMTSCLTIIEDLDLENGIAFIPYYQTKGKGRSGNAWLSPAGCAMFALQVHVPLNSHLGQHLPIIQFIASLAIVSSICELPELAELDIGIKWPNDIYANGNTKLGGVALKTTIRGDRAITNIGCGLNLNNKEPTACLNDFIKIFANEKEVKIKPISFEKYFSSVFNKMEEIFAMFSENRTHEFYQAYYQYWLHSDAEVKIKSEDDSMLTGKISGIDDYGYLLVVTPDGKTRTVHPDGNSFDMMAGLISPKMSQ